MVALPNLRQGSRILTPDGERAVKRAKQKAKQKPLAAAGSTWHGLVTLPRVLARFGRRAGRIWAPISAVLHEAMDRLEAKDAAKRAEASDADRDTPDGDKAETPIRHVAGHPRSDSGRSEDAEVTGGASVGRPRPMPAISGPIPEIAENGRTSAQPPPAEPAAEPANRTIDLREAHRSDSRREADQDAGGARRAR